MKENKKWRYYKKTVILKSAVEAKKYGDEALENGFDVSALLGFIVFGKHTRDMLPVITIHEAGMYWGRLWFHEKVYGVNSALNYTELPKYYANVGGVKVEVSKESYEAIIAEEKRQAEAKRKANIWRPEFVTRPKDLLTFNRMVELGYGLPSAEYMVTDKDFLKGTEIDGVKPLTLFYYTEAYAKKYGDGSDNINRILNPTHYGKKFISYHTKHKAWRITYSDYAKPFTTIFYGRDKAEDCLKWLKDLGVIG